MNNFSSVFLFFIMISALFSSTEARVFLNDGHSTESLDPLGWMDKPCQKGNDEPCTDWGDDMCCYYSWYVDDEGARFDEYTCMNRT